MVDVTIPVTEPAGASDKDMAYFATQVQQALDNLNAGLGFSAFMSADDLNVTGTAATGLYTVVFDTEINDAGADYDNTTGIYTAPVNGQYLFNTCVRLNGMTAASDQYTIRIVTSNRDYFWSLTDSAATIGTISLNLSAHADMEAGDTAHVAVLVIEEGGGDVVDILGDATRIETWFSGHLLRAT